MCVGSEPFFSDFFFLEGGEDVFNVTNDFWGEG